jgi:hypothetical protein
LTSIGKLGKVKPDCVPEVGKADYGVTAVAVALVAGHDSLAGWNNEL